MTNRIVLVVAFGVLVSGGFANAQMDGPPQPDGPMQGLTRGEGRLSDRFLASFDLNHDGKVARDELGKADAVRFAAAAHGAGAIGPDQLAQMYLPKLQKHVEQMFRRLDWNGDGRLSLDEYAAPQRVRFQMLDRDGSGSERCAGPQQAAFKPGRGAGHARFCTENDLNRDGSVTHAEFDNVLAKRYAALTANAKAMTPQQFALDALKHYRETNARFFKRIDADHDGKLTLAEYSASDRKLFARLDRNKDGTVTRDELQPRTDAYKRGGGG